MEMFSRTELLLGREAIEKLQQMAQKLSKM